MTVDIRHVYLAASHGQLIPTKWVIEMRGVR